MKKWSYGILIAFFVLCLTAGISTAGVVLGLPDFTTVGSVSYNSGTGILTSTQTPLALTYDGINFINLISGTTTFSAQFSSASSAGGLVTGYFNSNNSAVPDFSLAAYDGTNNYLLEGNFDFLKVVGYIGTNTGIAEAMISLTNISPNLTQYFDGRAGLLSLQFNIVPAFSSASFTSNFSGSAKTDIASVPEPGTMMLVGMGLVGLAYLGRRRSKQIK